jgi:hypothetical protein
VHLPLPRLGAAIAALHAAHSAISGVFRLQEKRILSISEHPIARPRERVLSTLEDSATYIKNAPEPQGHTLGARQSLKGPMTGPELKQLREDLGDAIGRALSAADMAKLSGLPSGIGADTIRKWEVTGPSGPVAELLGILAMASDRHPILENFNVFDRFNIPENQRDQRREEFREKMRDEVRGRLERG